MQPCNSSAPCSTQERLRKRKPRTPLLTANLSKDPVKYLDLMVPNVSSPVIGCESLDEIQTLKRG